MIAVVDSSALVEAAEARTPFHREVSAAMMRPDLTLIVPAMVVAEATYLIGQRLGPVIEARFLAGMADVEIEAPLREDWQRIADLVHQYRSNVFGIQRQRFRPCAIVLLLTAIVKQLPARMIGLAERHAKNML